MRNSHQISSVILAVIYLCAFLSLAQASVLSKTTVGDIAWYYHGNGQTPCIVTASTMNSCHYTNIECVASCANEPSCMYATTTFNLCLRCIGATAYNATLQEEYGSALNESVAVYAKIQAADVTSSITGCDVALVNNGGGGGEFSDETRAEGKTLTGIDFCLNSGKSGL